jgi:outer membrane immunogenic protein
MRIGKIAAIALIAGVGMTGAAMAQAPLYNWTGGYVGAFGGYGWSSSNSSAAQFYEDEGDTDPAGEGDPFSMTGNGVLGGVEAGYGWQAGNVVVGLDADFAWANIKGTFTDPGNFSVDSTIRWLSTVRGRIGVPVDRFLVYGTAGLAAGGVRADLHDYYGGTIDTTSTVTSVGWTAGAGIAAAITNNWVAKAEYLYVDLGKQNHTFMEGDEGWGRITSSSKTTANLLKFSIDYKF